jgi:hypothetical protein
MSSKLYKCLDKESIIKSNDYLNELAKEINRGRLCLVDARHDHREYHLILDKNINKVVYKSLEVGDDIIVKGGKVGFSVNKVHIEEHDTITPEKLKDYLLFTHMVVDVY